MTPKPTLITFIVLNSILALTVLISLVFNQSISNATPFFVLLFLFVITINHIFCGASGIYMGMRGGVLGLFSLGLFSMVLNLIFGFSFALITYYFIKALLAGQTFFQKSTEFVPFLLEQGLTFIIFAFVYFATYILNIILCSIHLKEFSKK